MKKPADFWKSLNAKQKQMLVLGVAVTVALLGAMLFVRSGPEPQARTTGTQAESVVNRVFTGADTRDVSMDGMGQQIRDLQRQVERLQRQKPDSSDQTISLQPEDTTQEINTLREEMRAEIDALQGIIAQQREALEAQKSAQPLYAPPMDSTRRRPGADEAAPPEADARQTHNVFDREPQPSIAPQPQQAMEGEQQDQTIRTIRPDIPSVEDIERQAAQEALASYLPIGSIISGTLITGMDAPTGRQARRDPFPVLLRVKDQTILPNRFRMNLAECFILATGYGSLSSERAMLRTEAISCVHSDGEVTEYNLRAFATGSDGKNGIRGRLVTKQGQVVARSMQAGFMQGFAQMFQSQRVPRIRVDQTGRGNDTAAFEQAFSSQAAQSAALSGAGNALDRVAQFLMDQAAEMYPVIEVDAGREVSFIVTSGAQIREME